MTFNRRGDNSTNIQGKKIKETKKTSKFSQNNKEKKIVKKKSRPKWS